MAVDIVDKLRCHFADCDGTCATVVAANEIVRLRAVLDAIDALHQPYESHIPHMTCECCGYIWPCDTHLLIRPDVPA